MTKLSSPLDEKTVRSLKAGDVVYLDGPIVTGRDEVHIRALKYLREGKNVPDCLYGAVLYHCGPIMSESDGFHVVAAGPTTSARMNSMESDMINEFGLRAIIGKGGMSDDVADTMKRKGCVYLSATGGAAVTLAEGITDVEGVEWEDLGMSEAMWKFNVNRLGPLIVTIDCDGNNLYRKVRESLKR